MSSIFQPFLDLFQLKVGLRLAVEPPAGTQTMQVSDSASCALTALSRPTPGPTPLKSAWCTCPHGGVTLWSVPGLPLPRVRFFTPELAAPASEAEGGGELWGWGWDWGLGLG